MASNFVSGYLTQEALKLVQDALSPIGISSPENIISYLNGFSDIARSNRFRVMIYPPVALATRVGPLIGYSSPSRPLSLQCESCELPGRTFGLASSRTYGPTIKIPTQTEYSDLPLTFFGTGNFAGTTQTGMWERVLFEEWLELISPTVPNGFMSSRIGGSHNFNYHDSYIGTVDIIHYDSQEAQTYICRFFDAFPTVLDNIGLSWSDSDSVMKMSVTMSYTRWQRISLPINFSITGPGGVISPLLGNLGISALTFSRTGFIK